MQVFFSSMDTALRSSFSLIVMRVLLRLLLFFEVFHVALCAGFEPLAVDFAAVAGCHEGMDMVLFHVLEKSSVFVLGEKGLNLNTRLFSKSTSDFI